MPLWRAPARAKPLRRRRRAGRARRRSSAATTSSRCCSATFARALRESSVQLVTITGEPGVGKTRLVAELRDWVDDRAGARLLAPGPLPALRRGHHVLGARRDRQGARGHPRVRRARGGAEKLAAAVGRTVDERRPSWSGCGRLAPLVGLEAERRRDRATSRSPPGGASSRASAAQRPLVARVRGPALGRRGAAGVRRAPRRLVDRRAAARRLHGPAGAVRAAPGLGRRQAELDHDRAVAAVVETRPHGSSSALLERAVLPAETQARAARAGRRQPALRGGVRADARDRGLDGRGRVATGHAACRRRCRR